MLKIWVLVTVCAQRVPVVLFKIGTDGKEWY